MKNQIIAIAVALSIIAATVLLAPMQTCMHVCVNPALVISARTTSAVITTAYNHAPNNHNLQELAGSLEKNHDFANSADYMEGLTSISKRSIYVGEADGSASQKLNL